MCEHASVCVWAFLVTGVLAGLERVLPQSEHREAMLQSGGA